LANELTRSKELYEKQLVAAETYEEILYRYEVQKANYDLAQLNMEYTQIKAPISGTVSERMIKKGNMIGVDSPLFQLVQMQVLEAMLYVPEHELYKIRPNQTVALQVDAIPGQLFYGNVDRISPSIDATTGTFRVTLSINQPDGNSATGRATDQLSRLKPGMFGRVNIKYDTRQNAVMIPKVALISEDRTNVVYVAADSMVMKRSVETGYEENGWIEIRSGLSAQEAVVTVGQTTLSDSARIQIIPGSK
jgi:RND family efflux transporter MFP subunit